MRSRQLCAVVGIACFFSLAAGPDAQTRGQRPPAAAQPVAASTAEWLAAPDRGAPSPNIVAMTGIGTANAVAEARMTKQALSEYCSGQGHSGASLSACLKEQMAESGSKIFRASADCTAGRITTTAEQAYTLDGLWDASDIGAGRTRWRDAQGTVVARDNLSNGLHVAQQWELLCPAPVSAALIARAARARSAAPQSARPLAQGSRLTAAAPATAAAPSACAGQRYCDEVSSFSAVITDFRPSIYNQYTRLVSATVRFQNKTNRPLILGYIQNAAVAIDEQGNRYTINSDANVRGIGAIAGAAFDPKFVVQPGQAADARFELAWRWNGRDIIGQRAWDIDLTVREVGEVSPGQYRFGQEHALQFKGVAGGNTTSAPAAGGALARTPVGGGASPSPAAAPPAQVAADEPDACAGRPRCYDAGPFVAEMTNAIATRQNTARPWHSVGLNIRFRNKTTEPIILGYVSGTGVIIDDLGNRYAPSAPPNDVKGMGRVQANKADPQFVLRPGETRAATFGLARVMRGTPSAGVIGSSYNFDVSIAQLEVLYNGQQIRTQREHSLTFPNFGVSGAGAGGGSTTGNAPDAESLKKAGDAIRSIFKK